MVCHWPYAPHGDLRIGTLLLVLDPILSELRPKNCVQNSFCRDFNKERVENTVFGSVSLNF